ncbi:MAG: hypothetical protein Q7S40_24325 [Opitutaceae bacterium]|nr:hypothetical protein [Opitutaceae bacterium]
MQTISPTVVAADARRLGLAKCSFFSLVTPAATPGLAVSIQWTTANEREWTQIPEKEGKIAQVNHGHRLVDRFHAPPDALSIRVNWRLFAVELNCSGFDL